MTEPKEKKVFNAAGDRYTSLKTDKKKESPKNSEDLWQYQSISDFFYKLAK